MREKMMLFVLCLLLGVSQALAQAINVKGVVVDETNAPLPGVSVALKSTPTKGTVSDIDRKSTRLNSSHANISYAVFCLKKKKNNDIHKRTYSQTIETI